MKLAFRSGKKLFGIRKVIQPRSCLSFVHFDLTVNIEQMFMTFRLSLNNCYFLELGCKRNDNCDDTKLVISIF